ncbi:Hint domain-containing protein [Leisingera sp. JC1]|uniref:Hint domain-containing protein n=1 Tax=Leisingera sp. JC1 TaxID=1855282 RepID=UPI000A55B15C|nr:Hint domain-containing protein [Leisingera sp. JC1]
MIDGELEVPSTTNTQKFLAVAGAVLSYGGDGAQAAGSIVENATESAASFINQNYVTDPSASALLRSGAETVENTVLAAGKFGKAFSSLASSAASWGSSLFYYSAGTLRNIQLEEAGIQPVYDTDILSEIDIGVFSWNYSEPSIEHETSLSASRRQVLNGLDDAVTSLREVISDSSLNISNPDKLDAALAALLQARQLADTSSDLAVAVRYIGESMEAVQSATNELSEAFQAEITKASQQFDELNPYIGDGAEEFVELLERMSNSGAEFVDMGSDAYAALASFVSAGGALTEVALEEFIEANLPREVLLSLPLRHEQRELLIDVIYEDKKCFAAGTLISMADGSQKPIEEVAADDWVLSFDQNSGQTVPGRVTRTFQNDAKILLDFHGTRVTPGHVYYRPDSKKPYKFETLIDVLRDDGVIQHQDGSLIRAATNVPVGDPRDCFVKAVTGPRSADGSVEAKDQGRIRLGTRFLAGEGKSRKSWSVADLIEAGGGIVGDDELIRVGEGEPMPFHWEFGDTLPKPEDFVLACSGTTLEDIYKAAEWESQGPRLPAPAVLDGGPVRPLSDAALAAMPRNEPLEVAHAPTAAEAPRRGLNRKQRKAMEARQRKAAKTRKPVLN